jgi:hypothetical protein
LNRGRATEGVSIVVVGTLCEQKRGGKGEGGRESEAQQRSTAKAWANK